MRPLEKAARALCLSQSGVDCFDDLEPEAQEAALETVRAVLQAVREPGDEVIDAGVDTLTERGCNPLSGDAEAVWSAMIDKALSE